MKFIKVLLVTISSDFVTGGMEAPGRDKEEVGLVPAFFVVAT